MQINHNQAIAYNNANNMHTAYQTVNTFQVNVKPGWRAGTRVIFPREGDQRRSRIPADIIFVVKDKPHPKFTRDGDNLKYTAKITLKHALLRQNIEVRKLQFMSLRPFQLYMAKIQKNVRILKLSVKLKEEEEEEAEEELSLSYSRFCLVEHSITTLF